MHLELTAKALKQASFRGFDENCNSSNTRLTYMLNSIISYAHEKLWRSKFIYFMQIRLQLNDCVSLPIIILNMFRVIFENQLLSFKGALRLFCRRKFSLHSHNRYPIKIRLSLANRRQRPLYNGCH